MNLELVATIRTVRFTPVRIRAGYDMEAVDELLEQLERAASRGLPLQPLVDQSTFATVKWREGYDVVEVDQFLAEITSAAVLATESLTTPADALACAVRSPTASPVIERQPATGRRLFRRT